MSFTDADYPADPYPGARPAFSFVHEAGALRKIEGAADLAGRTPVLAYGSNACPSKITWLREELGLTGAVTVLRATCHDLAAVWAAGVRKRDEQRPATLAAMPGVTEVHALWLATPEQLTVLDVCEGRGDRYHLAKLHSGRIVLDDGSLVEALAYVGAGAQRMPLLVDGHPVRTADVPQESAVALVGEPAESDGLDRTVIFGC